MKIISWNVNGIRAAWKNGGLEKVEKLGAEIYCFQETKAKIEEFPPNLFLFRNYFCFPNSAKKGGYSGVAIFSKLKPKGVEKIFGFERFDNEGRFLKLDFSDFILINIYIPHGSREKENLDYKLEVYNQLFKYLNKIKNKKIILIGDFNIAHQEVDLARPKENKNNIMFTPQERKQIDKLISLGFVDTFRVFNKEAGNYTWWPYSFEARKRNLGWRIDYCFVSKPFLPQIKDAFIFKEISGSDHCPIGIETF